MHSSFFYVIISLSLIRKINPAQNTKRRYIIIMKKTLAIILLIFTVLSSLFATPIAAAKGNVYTNTLDIASIRQNSSGNGYDWNNIDGILELNNITIETTDEIALKIPDNAVINLKGKNYVKASKIAITCLTSATFQGTGSLTVISEDMGIQCLSISSEDSVRFRSDNITVTAKTGVYSENATLIFSAKSMEITGTDYAIKGEKVKLSGGSLTANGRIYADETLTVNAVNLSATAPDKALHSSRKIEISSVTLSSGESLQTLNAAESYNGEKAIKTVSTVKVEKKGVLFGGRFHVFFDYLTFVLIIIAISAVIILPIYFKYKRTQKIKATKK